MTITNIAKHHFQHMILQVQIQFKLLITKLIHTISKLQYNSKAPHACRTNITIHYDHNSMQNKAHI